MTPTCAICGGTSTQLVAGQLFCTICSSQITSFQEYDMDDPVAVRGALKLRTAKLVKPSIEMNENAVEDMDLKTPGKVKRKMVHQGAEKEGETSSLSKLKNDVAMAGENIDSHLRVVGRRLLTFTKVIGKVTRTLTEDYEFPENFSTAAFVLWQLYLKHCEIAFHDTEFEADLNSMYRTLVEKKLTVRETSKVQADKLKKKKFEATKALNKSMNPLQLLISEEIDEDLGLVTDAVQETTGIQEKKISTVHVIDTNINVHAYERASSVYLEPDLLISIVYGAALAVGCSWVSISDIVRWMNEDRFFLSTFEYVSMGKYSKKAHGQTVFTGKGIPLFEHQRVFLWFWQSIQSPIHQVEIDMEKMFTRYLYDLNLPTDFMKCIHTLYKLFPMVNIISDKTARLQGDIAEGISMSQAKQFSDVDQCFRKKLRNAAGNDVFFSTEVKVLAFILLTLKLRFGLDDRDESILDDEFNIATWAYQLKMRLLFMDGQSATEILNNDLPFKSHSLEFAFGHDMIFLRKKFAEGTHYALNRKSRNRNFVNSCPSIKNIEQNNMLPSYIPPDLCRKANRSETGRKVLLSPLRFQANAMRDYMNQARETDEKEELKKVIDQKCLDLFLEDFGAYALPFDEKQSWESIFPKSNDVKRYPRPLWAQGSLYTYSGSKKRRLIGIDQKQFFGPCALFVSKKSCTDSHTAALPYMSNTFKSILECFSKLIGEADSVLYACYSMLELLVCDNERQKKIEADLIEGSTIPLEYALFASNGESTQYSGRISAFYEIGSARDAKIYNLGYSEDYGIFNVDDDENADSAKSMKEPEESSSGSESEDTITEEDSTTSSDESSTTDLERCEYQLEKLGTTDYENILLKKSRKKMFFSQRVYDWDTIWHILATKYW